MSHRSRRQSRRLSPGRGSTCRVCPLSVKVNVTCMLRSKVQCEDSRYCASLASEPASGGQVHRGVQVAAYARTCGLYRMHSAGTIKHLTERCCHWVTHLAKLSKRWRQEQDRVTTSSTPPRHNSCHRRRGVVEALEQRGEISVCDRVVIYRVDNHRVEVIRTGLQAKACRTELASVNVVVAHDDQPRRQRDGVRLGRQHRDDRRDTQAIQSFDGAQQERLPPEAHECLGTEPQPRASACRQHQPRNPMLRNRPLRR